MKEISENMWKTYVVINEWIRFSDTKAVALLAANGTILTIVFSKSIDNSEYLLKNFIILDIIIFGFVFGLISIIYAILCLNPTLNVGEPKSLIYFGHIAKRYDNCNRYRIEVMAAFKDDSGIIDQITNQVWANSKVSWKKYVNITWAIRFFMGAIIFFALAGIKLASSVIFNQ